MTARYPFHTALVTGASSGIGEELTRQLVAAGVPVVAVARRRDRLEALAEELGSVEVLVADLATRAGVSAVATRIARGDRPVELVVNNAGFGTSGDFAELDVERLSREIAVNVDALTRLAHAALASMLPRGRGWLLNTSSFAGFQPAPRLAVYAATKAYVTSLSESLHQEVSGRGVVVTALCPGLVRTEFQAVSNSGRHQAAFPDIVWVDVARVATSALEATAKGRALVVPGALYKGASWAVNVTPRCLRRMASSLIQRG
ncbi:MAG: SDR family NAD(P)-dependent oxidoreductase [Ilumatobacteraceae bacterium]